MTSSLGQLISEAIEAFRAAGIQSARSEAELIIAHVLNEDKSYVIAHNEFERTVAQTERIRKLFNQRAQRVPMSYVLGQREFFGRTFQVDDRALTPRVETEVIVMQARQNAPAHAAILDIGTGCGAIGMSLKLERPDVRITLSDVSPAALELAHENGQRLLKSPDDATYVQSDLFENLPERYDVIVANLPYVSEEADVMPEVQREPQVALYGGSGDGLALYRRFFAGVRDHLSAKGLVYIESDPWQQPALTALARTAHLQPIFHDYFILGFQADSVT